MSAAGAIPAMKDLSQIKRPWIESLGDRCCHILQMPCDQRLSIRVATVAFVNAARLKMRRPDTTGELWRCPSDAIDRLAEECLRDQLQPLLTGDPVKLGLQIRTAIQNTLFPKAVARWQETVDNSTRAHWLIGRLCNLGLKAHEWADGLGERFGGFYESLLSTEKFICNLLFWWERDDYDFTTTSLVHEYMHFAVYRSACEAELMSSLAGLFTQLGDPKAPVWNENHWLTAGWCAGQLLAKSPELPRILNENPAVAIDSTIEHFSRFRLTSMRHRDLVACYIKHCREPGLKARGPDFAVRLCLHAFDYACWMRVQQLIDLPELMKSSELGNENREEVSSTTP